MARVRLTPLPEPDPADFADEPISRQVLHALAHPTVPRPITLGAVSLATGLSRQYLSKILNGHQMPGLRVARALAVGLGITLDQLLERMQTQLEGTPAWQETERYGQFMGLPRKPEKVDVHGPAHTAKVLAQREGR